MLKNFSKKKKGVCVWLPENHFYSSWIEVHASYSWNKVYRAWTGFSNYTAFKYALTCLSLFLTFGNLELVPEIETNEMGEGLKKKKKKGS